MVPMIKRFIKHRAEPTVFAIETDEEGTILAALDVTDEATKGGLCPHMIASMPLSGHVEDIEFLSRKIDDEFDDYVPECGNVHHLMNDLLQMEREHRDAAASFAMADSTAKAKKKSMELAGQKVHDLLQRIEDRKPLPLFEVAGV
jgi:hypothetical protein